MDYWELNQLQTRWNSNLSKYTDSTENLTTTQKKKIQKIAETLFEEIIVASKKGF